MVKIYAYENCSTCRKALKYLDDKNVAYEKIPIVERPPTTAELKQMLQHLKSNGGSLKALFNASGQLYREMNIAAKLKAGMSEQQAIELLAHNGKLIKRPFLLVKNGGTVGFKPEVWAKLL